MPCQRARCGRSTQVFCRSRTFRLPVSGALNSAIASSSCSRRAGGLQLLLEHLPLVLRENPYPAADHELGCDPLQRRSVGLAAIARRELRKRLRMEANVASTMRVSTWPSPGLKTHGSNQPLDDLNFGCRRLRSDIGRAKHGAVERCARCAGRSGYITPFVGERLCRTQRDRRNC